MDPRIDRLARRLRGPTRLVSSITRSGASSSSCHDQGANRQAARGVMKVLSGLWRREVMAPAKPAEIRRVLFEQAAACDDREQAIVAAAKELGVSSEQMLAGLFADRPGRTAPPGPGRTARPTKRRGDVQPRPRAGSALPIGIRRSACPAEPFVPSFRFAKLRGTAVHLQHRPSGYDD